MKIQSWAIIGAMLIVAGCHTASPLSSEQRELAKFTRTGAIHDIRIGEVVTPPQITVKPGDEVRWVNVWTLSRSTRLYGFTGRPSLLPE